MIVILPDEIQKLLSILHFSRLDGKHVVFGVSEFEVIEGMDIVKQMEAQGTQTGKPNAEVNHYLFIYHVLIS